ncbi:MAG: DsbA family protein [Phenylobacterium sp.]
MRAASRLVTSPARRGLGRAVHALRRRARGGRPVVGYFHQVDDPYSHLAVQVLQPLAHRYGVELKVWLVPPPDDAAAPERERLRTYGLRDAARLARAYGLAFPQGAPDAEAVALCGRVLARAQGSGRFSEIAQAAGAALWSGDGAALTALAAEEGAASSGELAASLEAGAAERLRFGHYLGGMFYFEGEWFWGVDRLGLLEKRLAGFDTAPAGTPTLAPLRDMALEAFLPSQTPLVIELWFSFRSPYSWLVLPRIRRLARHYGAALELRFILPMVMRGLPVPPVKRRYIMLDCKREAERLGLPFGRIVDPVGAGVERAIAVLHHAIPLGLGEEVAELGLRAAFADGIALAEDPGLYDVARRAGLTDAQTTAALLDDGWRTPAEANRQALFDAGLWGAPSFRVNGLPAHWGQDRLWALDEDMQTLM